jgi:hypothetical protein
VAADTDIALSLRLGNRHDCGDFLSERKERSGSEFHANMRLEAGQFTQRRIAPPLASRAGIRGLRLRHACMKTAPRPPTGARVDG